MTINRLFLISAVAVSFPATLQSSVLFSSATPYIRTTQSAAIDQATARLPPIDLTSRRKIFTVPNDREFWRKAVISLSDKTMFRLNAGYVDALVKADSVRSSLSSLKEVRRGASSQSESISTLADAEDGFEARWNVVPTAKFALVNAMIGAFSNSGAKERFNVEPFVTLAYVHTTLGYFSSLSAGSIRNQKDHPLGASGTQIGSALFQGEIDPADMSLPKAFIKTSIKSDREFTEKGSGALAMLAKW